MKPVCTQWLGIGRLTTSPDWKAPGHSHPFVEMMVLFGGRIAIRIGPERVIASTGDIVLYPPGVRHQEQGEGAVQLDFAFFSFKGDAPQAPPVTHDDEGKVRVLTEWLLQEQSCGYARKDVVMHALLAALLAEFEKLAMHPQHALVESIRSFLKDRLHEPLSVADLADHANMSRSHFIRTYRSLSGRTPMSDVRRMRVDAARDLLITTDLPLKTIARRVGFCDEYHLSRVFRRHFHVPPGYFRKR